MMDTEPLLSLEDTADPEAQEEGRPTPEGGYHNPALQDELQNGCDDYLYAQQAPLNVGFGDASQFYSEGCSPPYHVQPHLIEI